MDDFPRSLTLLITNASDADMIVNSAVLTGGSWATAPVPGTQIPSTGQQSYVNGAPTRN
jgi:hypothetical protein